MEIQNKNKINGTKTNSLVEAIITLVSNYLNYGSFGKHYLKQFFILFHHRSSCHFKVSLFCGLKSPLLTEQSDISLNTNIFDHWDYNFLQQ